MSRGQRNTLLSQLLASWSHYLILCIYMNGTCMLSRCYQKPTYYVYLHFLFLSHCQKRGCFHFVLFLMRSECTSQRIKYGQINAACSQRKTYEKTFISSQRLLTNHKQIHLLFHHIFLCSCASFVVLQLGIHFLNNSVIKITSQQWQVKCVFSEDAV